MPVNSFAGRELSWKPSRGFRGAGAIYLALAAELADDISSGKLAPGTRLPPQRELADFLDIDFTTVTRAYGLCRERGLVYGVTGRGTFVSPPVSPAGERRPEYDCGVVQCFPSVGAEETLAAARDVLSRESARHLFSYADRGGSERTRRAGAAWLSKMGVKTPLDRIAVFPGAQGAITCALVSLLKVGDSVATDEWTYSNLIKLARLAHVKLTPVPSDGKGMIPGALAEAAGNDRRLNAVFLMPNSANPTALTLGEERRKELAAVTAKFGLALIEDDSSVSAGAQTISSMAPDNSVYIAGATRVIAPGLRATWMAFPERFSKRILDALHHLAIKASSLEAEILGELVLSGRADLIAGAKTGKAQAANRIFDEVFGSGGDGGTDFFRTLPLPGTSGRGMEIEAAFAGAGVKICHSDRFSVRPGNPESFLRVSVSSSPDLRSLRRALAIVKKESRRFTAPA